MLKNLINLLFPNLCNGCNALLLENEVLICAKCRHELPLTQLHLDPNNYMAKKFYGILPIEFCSAMLYFHQDGRVQNLIHQLKYKNIQIGFAVDSLENKSELAIVQDQFQEQFIEFQKQFNYDPEGQIPFPKQQAIGTVDLDDAF